MKCVRCGYVSSGQFYQCPACGAVQSTQYPINYAATPYRVTPVKRRSGGETAAIIFAIVVAVISFIAAIGVFISYTGYVASKVISDDHFNIDSFDQITSDDDIADFFKEFNNGNGEFGFNSPAAINTPVKYKEKLYSFSEGEVETEYEVTMTGTYRGEAALKLLDGAVLPLYNKDKYDIYLVQFSVKITEQEKDAIVTLPISNPAAFPSDSTSIFSDEYSPISMLDYTNKYALISKGDSVQTWIAFIVDKEEQSPIIMWNITDNKTFRHNGNAITNPSSVESGAAIELKEKTDSESSSYDSVSDNTTSD